MTWIKNNDYFVIKMHRRMGPIFLGGGGEEGRTHIFSRFPRRITTKYSTSKRKRKKSSAQVFPEFAVIFPEYRRNVALLFCWGF